MNNFSLYVLGNYSPNIRTFGKYKNTCYRIKGFSKEVFLDFGAGIFFKFLRILKKEKIDINNIVIIISHNHIDHNFSLIFLSFYLLIYNILHKDKKRVEIYMPKKSIAYTFIKTFKNEYRLKILNESVKFNIDNVKFSFCKTIHKGESYATKLTIDKDVFVYTSDIALVCDNLKHFIKNVNTVLVDAGYPNKRFHSFQNYHGKTEKILKDVNELNIKRILATHIRFFSNYDDYVQKIPPNANVKILNVDDYFNLLD